MYHIYVHTKLTSHRAIIIIRGASSVLGGKHIISFALGLRGGLALALTPLCPNKVIASYFMK